jgi:hypothetical protein
MSIPLLVVFVSFRPSDLYEYDTRRKENLHVQSYNTLTREMGVVNMAIKLHNNLPMELRKGRKKLQTELKDIYWNTHTLLYRSSYQKDSRISKNLL